MWRKSIKLKYFSSLLVYSLLLATVFSLLVPVRALSESEILATRMDSYITRRMAEEKIPGLSVVIVKNGQYTYLRGFGVTSVYEGKPVTPETVFDLASCSKSFTALAVVTLARDSDLNLDAPVNRYLTELEFADKVKGSLITVRELLNHTSGLPGIFSEPMAFHNGPDAMAKLITAMKKVHLNREPGTTFEYSNLNYSILGALIERITGTRFEDYAKKTVFDPAGMDHTTLYPEAAARMERARGHQLLFGIVVPRDIEIFRSAAAAGWVMSTAEDMGKWLMLHLDHGMLDGRQVIPADLIELTHAPAVSYEENGDNVSYGMGWLSATSKDGTKVIWHGGDTPNFVSEMILVPDRDTGIVMLVNGQISPYIHTIAADILNMELDHDLILPEAPWWSSWEAIDRIATGALALSLVFFIGLIIFIWRKLLNRKRTAGQPVTYKIWRIVLPSAPLVLIGLAILAVSLLTQIVLGYNLFRTLNRFSEYAPPGVSISALVLFVVLCLWLLALAGTSFYRAHKHLQN